jgi:hypothetical protein
LVDESGTAFVFALEVEGGGRAASTGGSVSTHGLGRGLLSGQVGSSGLVRSRDVCEGVAEGVFLDGLGTPGDVVELAHLLVVQE